MSTPDFKRKLSAAFSSDVAGYSWLMSEDGSATVKTLEAHKKATFICADASVILLKKQLKMVSGLDF